MEIPWKAGEDDPGRYGKATISDNAMMATLHQLVGRFGPFRMKTVEGDGFLADLLEEEADKFQAEVCDHSNEHQIDQAGQVLYKTTPSAGDHLEDAAEQIVHETACLREDAEHAGQVDQDQYEIDQITAVIAD